MRRMGCEATVVSYTAFMKVLLDHGRPREAAVVYREMLEAGSSHRDGGESGLQSEDDEARKQRLLRTGQHINSFDVEALKVPCAQRNHFERLIRTWQHIDSFDLEALEVPCAQRTSGEQQLIRTGQHID